MTRPRLSRLAWSLHDGKFEASLDIPSCLVVIGNNETGKSSILSAIDIALHGRKGTPVDGVTFDWSVSAMFDGAGQIGRYQSNGKPALRWGSMGGGTKEVQAKIDIAFGAAGSFRISDFIGANARDQQKILDQVLGVGSWTVDDIVGRPPVDGESEQAPYLPDLAKSLDELGLVMSEDRTDSRLFLNALLNKVREADLAANADATRLLKVVQQDEAERGTEPELPPGTVASWRARIAELDGQINDLERQVGAAGESAKRVRDTARALDLATQRERDADADVTKAVSEVAALNGAIAVGEKDLDTKNATMAEAKAVLAKRRLEEQAAQNALKEAKAKQDAARSLDYSLGAVAEIVGPPVRDAITLIEAAVSAPAPVSQLALFAARRPDEVQAVLSALRALRDRSYRATADSRSSVAPALPEEAGVAAAITALGAATRVESARVIEVRDAQTSLSQKRVLLVQQRTAEDRARVRQAAAQTGTTEAQAALVTGSDDSGDNAPLLEQINGMKLEKATATLNADALTDAAGREGARTSRLYDLAAAQSRRELARRLTGRILAVQTRMGSEQVGPMLADCNRILEAVTGATLEMDANDPAAKSLHLSLRRAGRLFGLDQASHSLRSCVYVALHTAIVSRMPGWRAVILDDAENLSKDRRERLVEALLDEVVGGRLDNVIVASVDDGWRPLAVVPTIRIDTRPDGGVVLVDVKDGALERVYRENASLRA